MSSVQASLSSVCRSLVVNMHARQRTPAPTYLQLQPCSSLRETLVVKGTSFPPRDGDCGAKPSRNISHSNLARKKKLPEFSYKIKKEMHTKVSQLNCKIVVYVEKFCFYIKLKNWISENIRREKSRTFNVNVFLKRKRLDS